MVKQKSQIRIGAILSYTNILLNIVYGILIIPFLLKHLGQEEYGIYVLIGSIASTMMIMDFGVKTTVIRYISKYRAERKYFKIEEFLSNIFIIYMFIAVIVFISGGIVYFFIENIFSSSITKDSMHMTKLMFLIVVLNVGISLIMNAFPAIIDAHQKFTFSKSLDILNVLMRAILTFIFIINGYSALAIVIIDTFSNILLMILRLLYVRGILKITIKFKKPEKLLTLEILTFSRKVFISSVINQVNTRLDQFILGIVSTAGQVAISGIAITVIAHYHTLTQVLSNIFLPKITDMVMKKKTITEIQSYILKVSRLQAKLLTLLTVGFILLGKEFVYMWIGNGYEVVYWIIVMLMITNLLPYTQGVLLSLAQAMNLHGTRNIIYVIITIANLVISIPLASKYGAFGAAVGTGVSMLIGYGIFIQGYYQLKMGLNMLKYMYHSLGRLFPAILFTLITGYILNDFLDSNTLTFILKTLIITITYSTLVWLLDFTDFEKRLVKDILTSLSTKVKRRKV